MGRLTSTSRVVALAAVLAVVGVLPAFAADPNAGIEDAVRAVFKDAPDMIAVAKCESGYRQFAAEGVVLRGGAGGRYVGIFQIGEDLHRGVAAAQGMDIDTVTGNIAYARKLYDARGSYPWISCVPKGVAVTTSTAQADAPAVAPAPVSAATDTALKAVLLTADLRFGANGEQVRVLQRLLNSIGMTVAASGVGSKGHETTLFGNLTREAVRKFQCAKGITCSGSETTTGYGRVGPRTRAALNAATK